MFSYILGVQVGEAEADKGMVEYRAAHRVVQWWVQYCW